MRRFHLAMLIGFVVLSSACAPNAKVDALSGMGPYVTTVSEEIEAYRNNDSQALLKARIEELGTIAPAMAKRVPTLAALFV